MLGKLWEASQMLKKTFLHLFLIWDNAFVMIAF